METALAEMPAEISSEETFEMSLDELKNTEGITFRLGDGDTLVTNGRGGAFCFRNGKTYELCEKLVDDGQPGRKIYMAAVDFGPEAMPIPHTERDVMLPPKNRDYSIIPITTLMTRNDFFDALDAFHSTHPKKDNYRPYMEFSIEHGMFEILTKEYIEALGEYLENRTKELQTELKRPIKILEIAAGDGKLTHFLEEELKRRGIEGGVRLFATDSGQMHLQKLYHVINESHEEALWDFEPDIVLCSWMNKGTDLTEAVRKTPTVDEYLLIGPADSETCGQAWETWGKHGPDGELPLFKRDGFERADLNKLSKLQYCQKDSEQTRYSRTVSFRRAKKSEAECVAEVQAGRTA